jgi:lipopolysaccharide biosynthesis protein
MFSILIHIYYPTSWNSFLRERLLDMAAFKPNLLINFCNINDNKQLISTIKADFPQAFFTVTPNKGKDIGGKLALMDLYLKLKLESDYLVFLHDKISPHALQGDVWRKTLFKIIEKDNIERILELFKNHQNIGIIGAKEFIQNEYDEKLKKFDTPNETNIKFLLNHFGLKINRFSFIGGTMFWVRSSIMTDFFKQHPPLKYRKMLEYGNVMDTNKGTLSHTWERILSWIAVENHSMKGI